MPDAKVLRREIESVIEPERGDRRQLAGGTRAGGRGDRRGYRQARAYAGGDRRIDRGQRGLTSLPIGDCRLAIHGSAIAECRFGLLIHSAVFSLQWQPSAVRVPLRAGPDVKEPGRSQRRCRRHRHAAHWDDRTFIHALKARRDRERKHLVSIHSCLRGTLAFTGKIDMSISPPSFSEAAIDGQHERHHARHAARA